MSAPIKVLVALDDGVDRDVVQAALPSDNGVQIVGVSTASRRAGRRCRRSPTDLLVVACAGYSDRALFLIDGAVKQRPDRPVVVLSAGSPNGFVRRVFEAGADDIVTPARERPSRSRSRSRRRSPASRAPPTRTGVALAPMICVLGPKGGTGKTLTASQPRRRARRRRAPRRRSSTSTSSSATSGSALGLAPEQTIYDLANSGGSLDAEKLDAYLADASSRAHACSLAPTRPDQAGAITTEFLREVYAAAALDARLS